MRYRRNSDEEIRRLERELSLTNSRSDAIKLYLAKKRAGDSMAGAEYYDWLLEQAYPILEVADPTARVWWVDGSLFCDECGPEAALNADREAGIAPNFSYSSDPDRAEANYIAYEDELRRRDSYQNLRALLQQIGQQIGFDPDEQLICRACSIILKLNNEPASWQEVLME